MITKINKDGSNYAELFRQAEEQLGKAANSITSIHEYLDALSEVNDQTGLPVRQDTNNYNLLRLPVEEDEPLFEIDANTREIKVPDVFKKNGLTVQGDKLAEIVYFKMARFFDMMDLYRFANNGVSQRTIAEGAHTYIEWQNLNSNNPDYEKGVDFAYAMTCDDSYIYFGWPLADFVSGDAGQIQFAIRFLEVDEQTGKVVYNYSTKIAQCEIKSTLNFNLMDGSITQESWEDILYTRPIYSSVINSTQSPAPILLRGIETAVRDLEPTEVEENEETVTKLLLPIPVDATISTAVGVGEQQTLIFKWLKNGAQVTSAADIAAHIVEGAVPDSEDPNAKRSTYTADSVGTYTVWIGNKITGKKNVRYIYTGTINIPSPKAVAINNNGIDERNYLGTVLEAGILGTKAPEETLYYTWYKYVDGEAVEVRPRSTAASYTPDDEGIYYCMVQNYRNGEYTELGAANTTSREADIRAFPQKINNADIDLQYSDDGHFFTATILNRRYPNHKVHYVWFRLDSETGLPVKVDEMENFGVCELSIDQGGRYYVEAREIVFPDDTVLRKEASLADRGRSEEIEITDRLVRKTN